MKYVERISYRGDEIALIIRNNIPVKGIRFFTDKDHPFQIGMHDRKKGILLPPHFHILKHTLHIDSIQEILLVQKGKIRVNLYSQKNKLIARKILNEGDSILLISGGHGVDFMKDARIFEVKQGPYPGTENAKKYIPK